MTAEIAVASRLGVALAADSAVTIGRSGRKIWTSAEKLFELSDVDPVGVMYYGVATIGGMPIEAVIREYRAQHGRESRKTVRDHLTAFIDFLNGHPMFLRSYQLNALETRARQYLSDLRSDAANLLAANSSEEATQEGIAKIAFLLLRQDRKAWRQAPTRECSEEFLSNLETVVLDVCNKELSDSSVGRLRLSDYATAVLLNKFTRKHVDTRGDYHTGLVFAGFGSEDFVPSILHVQSEEMLDGQFRWVEDEGRKYDGTSLTSVVLPFAQDEVVRSFMNGVEAHTLKKMQDATRDMVRGLARELLPEAGPTESHLALCDARLDGLFDQWDSFAESVWGPIVENIATLPKDELASVAEALVNITKFRRRASTDLETVGGPIDVAVITKGDGFIWIQRKHYFEAEMNPGFMGRRHVNRRTP